MMPGFVPRLHRELLRALERPHPRSRPGRSRPLPPYDPYAPLRPLAPWIAILNSPGPAPATVKVPSTGKAPAFAPAALPWLGGSLAGAMKIGGEEITRERWDEVDVELEEPVTTEPGEQLPHTRVRQGGSALSDWTRSPLPLGAPSANPIAQVTA